MGWFFGTCAAGGTCCSADSFFIQENEERTAFCELKADIAVACQAVFPASVQTGIRDFCQETADEMISHERRLFFCLLHLHGCQFGCFPKTDDSRYIFCAGSPPSLLSSPVHKWRQIHTTSHIEKTNAFGTAALVRAGAQHINVHLFYGDRQMPVCLHGVRVKENVTASGDCSNFFYRLYGSHLVVCHHDREEDCLRADSLFQLFQ